MCLPRKGPSKKIPKKKNSLPDFNSTCSAYRNSLCTASGWRTATPVLLPSTLIPSWFRFRGEKNVRDRSKNAFMLLRHSLTCTHTHSFWCKMFVGFHVQLISLPAKVQHWTPIWLTTAGKNPKRAKSEWRKMQSNACSLLWFRFTIITAISARDDAGILLRFNISAVLLKFNCF